MRFGLRFAHPLGLAAGFDKSAEVPDALLALGFAFVEVGTLTPLPQRGNAKPRLFRLPADAALVNRMGFNNDGFEAALARLTARREFRHPRRQFRPQQGRDRSHRGLRPGREDLRRRRELVHDQCFLAQHGRLARSAAPRGARRTRGARHRGARGGRPAPSGADQDRARPRFARARRHRRSGDLPRRRRPDRLEHDHRAAADAARTSIARDGRPFGSAAVPRFHPAVGPRLSALRGRPDVDRLRRRRGSATALAKIEAGATLVQLYTGFVYRGPQVIDDILDGPAGWRSRRAARNRSPRSSEPRPAISRRRRERGTL